MDIKKAELINDIAIELKRISNILPDERYKAYKCGDYQLLHESVFITLYHKESDDSPLVAFFQNVLDEGKVRIYSTFVGSMMWEFAIPSHSMNEEVIFNEMFSEYKGIRHITKEEALDSGYIFQLSTIHDQRTIDVLVLQACLNETIQDSTVSVYNDLRYYSTEELENVIHELKNFSA